MIVIMLVAFVVLAAITIDFAYVQLVRTEMRAVTDAAAKAGAEALARTESIDQARAAAVAYAAANTVAGDSYLLQTSDVKVGRLNLDGEDNWEFTENASPPNAVQIDARTGGAALHPAIPLMFAGVHGRPTFAPAYTATAGQQEVEVCLCLDRSGSMLFDMSGTEYAYPLPNPNQLMIYAGLSFPWPYHLSPPHPTASRWAVLAGAIDLFLEEAGNFNPPPRTALVTWSSTYQMPYWPYTQYQASTTDHPLPDPVGHTWSANSTALQNDVSALGGVSMMGATNLSAGLDRAVSVLTTGPNSKAFANKIVILLTDGQWNDGRDPVAAAIDARNAGVTVHCVLMLTADQPDIQQVATITGGRYYLTQNEAELRAAFQELARSLPVVLTQ